MTIHYPDYRLISVPRVLADLIAGPDEPYRLIRPVIASVDDALAWLHEQRWPHAELSSDERRRKAVYRLRFARHLVDEGWSSDD